MTKLGSVAFSLAVSASIGSLGHAQDAPDPCPGTIPVPVRLYPDRLDSPIWDFAIQVRYSNATFPLTMPWVVVLPGGPGSPSIGSDEGAIPLRYNVIFTDPRGAGCNPQAGGAPF